MAPRHEHGEHESDEPVRQLHGRRVPDREPGARTRRVARSPAGGAAPPTSRREPSRAARCRGEGRRRRSTARSPMRNGPTICPLRSGQTANNAAADQPDRPAAGRVQPDVRSRHDGDGKRDERQRKADHERDVWCRVEPDRPDRDHRDRPEERPAEHRRPGGCISWIGNVAGDRDRRRRHQDRDPARSGDRRQSRTPDHGRADDEHDREQKQRSAHPRDRGDELPAWRSRTRTSRR